MRRVIWSVAAIGGLERIRAHIAAFRPLAAERLAERLVKAANSLREDAERGRSLRGGRRELTVVHPYLIRYRVKGDTVMILEVRHGARRP